MPFEIDLTIPNLDKALGGFDKAAERAENLTKKMEELASAISSVGRRGAPSNGGPGIQGGSGGPSGPRYSDPWERANNLHTQRAWMVMGGASEKDLRGIDLAIKRAQRQVTRSETELRGKSQEEKMMDVIMTSRMGFSGGRMQLMPLVGKMASAGLVDPSKLVSQIAGMGNMSAMIPAIARLALPAAAIVAAGVGAYHLTESGAARTRDIGSALLTGGGTGRQTAQMAGIAGFLGMTAEQAAQRAVELGDRLRGGGYGAAYMRSRGVIDQGPWTTNKTDNFLKVIDELRNIKSDTQATRVARDLGLQNEMWVRYLSNSTYGRLKSSMAPIDRKEMEAEAEYRGQKQILGNAWDAHHRAGARANMDYVSRFLDRQSTGWWNWIPGVAAYNMSAEAFNTARQLPRDGGKGGANAVEENTKAIRDLQRTMKDHAEMIGGGARSRSLPVGLRGLILDQMLTSQSFQLGGFGLGVQ